MKLNLKPIGISLIALCLALPCFAARLWLFSTGTDSKGLFPSAHPGSILSVVLTIVSILILFALTRNIPNLSGKRNFPASVPALIGGLCGTAGIALTILVGIAAVVASVLLALHRYKNQASSILLRSCVILFFMLYLVLLYRPWSGEPQMQYYLFQTLALLGVALTNYYRICTEHGQKGTRAFVFVGQATVLLCCAATAGCDRLAIMLAFALWMLLDTCDPPQAKRQRPTLDLGESA